MAIIEDENNEQPINEMIEEVERDDIPTNVFDVAETDPMVLMGKINKIVLILKQLQDIINSVDFEHLDEQLTEIQNTIDGLSEVATTGDYDDLSNKPSLDFVEKSNTGKQIYGTDSSGNQTTYTISQSANASSIAQRASGGRLDVGTPTSDANATNKKYVDDTIADNMFSGDYNDLTNKPTLDFVEKSNENSKLYGTGQSGQQTTYPIGETADAGSIPIRLSGGKIYVGDPSNDGHATNKKYVDDTVSYKLGKPQNNYTTNRTQLHINYNQGDAIWSASEIDRACIVYIRGNFGATNTFRIVTPNNQYIYADLTNGQNSIVFLCQAGDKIEWYHKDNAYWCDTTKVNFGGNVI